MLKNEKKKNVKKKYIENKNSNIETDLSCYERLFDGKNEEYWSAYTGQILCRSPYMKITSNGRPKSSRIKTDMDIK